MCPSEVSDIDDNVWARYRDAGVVVWAIASDDPEDAVRAFADALALELPLLLDEGGAVKASYPQTMAFPTAAFPQLWVVGTDGRVAYVANEYEAGELTAVLEAELAGE